MPATSATPSLATFAAPLGPAFPARTTSAVLTARSAPPPSAATTFLAGIVGAHPASIRVSTELVATTEVATSPRSALGSI